MSISASPPAAKSKVLNYLVWGCLALGLVLLALKTFWIGYYVIPQNGMDPGLPAGSKLLTLRHPYSGPASVRRGDIVVFVVEEDGQPMHCIWRVVGLPGETVVAAGEILNISGQTVRRQRLREAGGRTLFREQIGSASYEIAFAPAPDQTAPDVTVTVPPGHFFVMGDNRFSAHDSRFIGPIPFRSIVGRKL